MDSLHKTEDDFEKVIEKDDCSIVTSDFRQEDIKYEKKSIREKLDHVINSANFMVTVIGLVVIDCLCVVAELLLDLEIVEIGKEYAYVPKIFHYASISILSIFILEISVRIYVMRMSFFKHKLEVFDAMVVIISFILDIIFISHEDASVGVGLLVALRLWRVTRVVNGIVMSVERQAEKKIAKERLCRESCEKELIKFQEYCTAQENEIAMLQELLQKHGVEFTANKISRPTSSVRLNVAAELNKVD